MTVKSDHRHQHLNSREVGKCCEQRCSRKHDAVPRILHDSSQGTCSFESNEQTTYNMRVPKVLKPPILITRSAPNPECCGLCFQFDCKWEIDRGETEGRCTRHLTTQMHQPSPALIVSASPVVSGRGEADPVMTYWVKTWSPSIKNSNCHTPVQNFWPDSVFGSRRSPCFVQRLDDLLGVAPNPASIKYEFHLNEMILSGMSDDWPHLSRPSCQLSSLSS
jgi:hypothetical protein